MTHAERFSLIPNAQTTVGLDHAVAQRRVLAELGAIGVLRKTVNFWEKSIAAAAGKRASEGTKTERN
jgi:hypothetical protein